MKGDQSVNILANTSRNNHTNSPLGQIVKEVVVTKDILEFEFCSKWFYRTNHGLKITRNLDKLLTTKQSYNKQNAHILKNPVLHRIAIYEGFKHECVSRVIEDILQFPTLGH